MRSSKNGIAGRKINTDLGDLFTLLFLADPC
jgi:hypothetical protein